MQLRALIKTRRRKWAMIVLGIVVCAAAVWLLLDVGHKPTDEEKLRSMLRSENRASRLEYFRTSDKFPRALNKPAFQLGTRWIVKSRKLREDLIASGYLVEVPCGTLDPYAFQVRYHLEAVVYIPLYQERIGQVMFCRSNDVARVRALIEKQP